MNVNWIFIAGLFFSSCGLVQQDDGDLITDEGFDKVEKADQVNYQMGVSYLNVAPGLFSLLDASSFIIDVVGCKSGYSRLDHDSSVSGGTIGLFSRDRDCEIQLKSFIWNAKTWTKSGGGNYSGPSAALFQNSTDSDLISVVSPQNLPATITGAGTVSFYFSVIEEGTQKQIVSAGVAQHLTNSANDAPWYQLKPISGVVLDSVAAGTNIADFTFRLECKTSVTTSDTICPTTTAQNQTQTSMRVALVKDTYGGVLSWANAQAAFNSAPHIVSILGGNLLSPAAGFNGGFAVQIAGPEDLSTSQKMILIVEFNAVAAGDRTYTAFTINFAGGASLLLTEATKR